MHIVALYVLISSSIQLAKQSLTNGGIVSFRLCSGLNWTHPCSLQRKMAIAQINSFRPLTKGVDPYRLIIRKNWWLIKKMLVTMKDGPVTKTCLRNVCAILRKKSKEAKYSVYTEFISTRNSFGAVGRMLYKALRVLKVLSFESQLRQLLFLRQRAHGFPSKRNLATRVGVDGWGWWRWLTK